MEQPPVSTEICGRCGGSGIIYRGIPPGLAAYSDNFSGCPGCDGTGLLLSRQQDECAVCHGSGKVIVSKRWPTFQRIFSSRRCPMCHGTGHLDSVSSRKTKEI